MAQGRNKIKVVFIVFWTLLFYTMAALIWWFFVLNIQNKKLSEVEIKEIIASDAQYQHKYNEIITDRNRKTVQYITEGCTFLLLILAGAIFIYRGFIRELKLSRDQRNFMMAITHELKTPIAVAKLNLETLQKHKLTENQQSQLLNNTLQEANRMDMLCNNLLVSSQIEGGKYKLTKEKLHLSEMINICVNEFTRRYPLRVLTKNIPQDIYATGDSFLLQIAFNNLLENAIKYSPKEKPIVVMFQKIEKWAILKVIDEGAGVTDADKKLVFEKFYRTGNEATKRAKGTGLGLFLTNQIAIAHNGNIKIEDNPNGGSIFILTLNAEA